MNKPKEISEFKEAILASEEIHDLVKKELGEQAYEKWAVFQRGENLDDLYELISNNATEYGEELDELEGAGPEDDVFPITVWKIGPLYLITAPEFEPLKYFGSSKEALDYAGNYFSGYIDALIERQMNEGYEEIASADDDVSQELLDWAGMDKIWDKYYLCEFEQFQDLAERSDHISISGKEWGGEVPGLSGVWQTAKTDNETALKKDLRGLVAELIWENRKQIHLYRKDFGANG